MFIVDDNFLTNDEILHYQNLLYLKNKTNWFLSRGSHGPEFSQDKTSLHSPETDNNLQFVHLAKRGDFESQPVCNDSIMLLNKFAEKHNIEVLLTTRIKANLIINSRTIKKQTNTAHVDSVKDLLKDEDMPDGQHLVLLYYVNTSDGPTIMYNEKHPVNSFENLSIKEKVQPKAGRAVLFEGDRYHASSSPIYTTLRCVLNINFIGKLKQNV